MATYYLKPAADGGSDAAAGTSTGTAWATLSFALGATSGFASGDTLYCKAGIYYSTAFTVAMTSPVANTKIIGDVDGAQFGTGGQVIFTSRARSTAAPSGTATINLGGRDYLWFENIYFEGGSGGCFIATTTQSTNITLYKCVITQDNSAISTLQFTGAADTAADWVVDTCIFRALGAAPVTITLTTSASADYDVNIQFKNCTFIPIGGTGMTITATGAGAFKGGGVDIVNCTFVGSSTGINCASANLSTSIPCTIKNSFLHCSGTALAANTSGQLTESFNFIIANVARSNVTTGVSSISSTGSLMLNMYDFGQSVLWGFTPRAYLTYYANPYSMQLGFGNDTGAAPSVDWFGLTRPSGGGITSSVSEDSGTATSGAASSLTDSGKSWTTNAFAEMILELTGGTGSGQVKTITSNTATVITVVGNWVTNPDNTTTYTVKHRGIYNAAGALERQFCAIQETSTVDAGSSGLKITGPGTHDIRIPVSASSTTITLRARYNSTHAATNKPQAILLANPEIGVTTETKTMTSAADTWETLTFAAQTPTAVGFVTVRVVSRSAAGNGIAYFDTFTGGASGSQGLDHFSRTEFLGAAVGGSEPFGVAQPVLIGNRLQVVGY